MVLARHLFIRTVSASKIRLNLGSRLREDNLLIKTLSFFGRRAIMNILLLVGASKPKIKGVL